MSIARATLRVDLDAVVHNWRVLDAAARPGRSGAVVKANAYGLGALPIARALVASGCSTLFVATCAEGIALREAGIDVAIYVFEGALAESAQTLASAELSPVLNDASQCARWRQILHASSAHMPYALHVDTGMARLGFAVDAFLATDAAWRRLPPPALLMTHLACADEPEHPQNAAQRAAFARCAAMLPDVVTSIGNSAATLAGLAIGSDLVRPGIALYGGNPFNDRRAVTLREVAAVHGPVLQVRALSGGASIGYGARFVTSGPMRVATVALGYADGYLRALGDRGWGVLRGQRVAVLGRVSMDLVVVDISALPDDVVPGEAVALLGAGVDLDELAAAAGTIGYELLTRLGSRLTRVYAGAGAA